jgi:hypothetical protein
MTCRFQAGAKLLQLKCVMAFRGHQRDSRIGAPFTLESPAPDRPSGRPCARHLLGRRQLHHRASTPVHTAVDWQALSKASSTSMRDLLQSGRKLTQTEWQLAPSIAARRCMRISVSWRAISTVNVVRALPNHLFVPPPSNIQSHRRRQ